MHAFSFFTPFRCTLYYFVYLFFYFFPFPPQVALNALARKPSIKVTGHSQAHTEKLCSLPCLQMLHHGNWPSPRKQTVAWLEVGSILLSFWMTAERC